MPAALVIGTVEKVESGPRRKTGRPAVRSFVMLVGETRCDAVDVPFGDALAAVPVGREALDEEAFLLAAGPGVACSTHTMVANATTAMPRHGERGDSFRVTRRALDAGCRVRCARRE